MAKLQNTARRRPSAPGDVLVDLLRTADKASALGARACAERLIEAIYSIVDFSGTGVLRAEDRTPEIGNDNAPYFLVKVEDDGLDRPVRHEMPQQVTRR